LPAHPQRRLHHVTKRRPRTGRPGCTGRYRPAGGQFRLHGTGPANSD